MQEEILPLLGDLPSDLAREWKPLVASRGDYGMKLKLFDKLTFSLIRSDDLMDQVEEIVVDSTYEAMLDEPQAFVTDLLASLMSDE
jgi:hypothetical protein